MPRTRLWKLVATGAVLTACLGVCPTNPVTGHKEVSLVTPAQELEIGRQRYGPIIAKYGLYDDAALSAYVNSIERRVAHVSHLPSPEWHLTVLDDQTVNASAMPGGYIYITRGILPYLNPKGQLDRLADLRALRSRGKDRAREAATPGVP